uniref:Uncharacterized protein n=1 Tax=Cacopsylla melanoneura TaxID=428564 RepID=A0A8D9FG96_9HEMI
MSLRGFPEDMVPNEIDWLTIPLGIATQVVPLCPIGVRDTGCAPLPYWCSRHRLCPSTLLGFATQANAPLPYWGSRHRLCTSALLVFATQVVPLCPIGVRDTG